MFSRVVKSLDSRSFFLFGARGTGKSTLLRKHFPKGDALWIDLLLPQEEERLSLDPQDLARQIAALGSCPSWVVIDEVQKVPALLDVVHHLIEDKGIRFALTGSSARKLKRGSANLLAGRAFVRELFPLVDAELGHQKNLMALLQWGGLPEAITLETKQDKQDYLRSYARTYLKEEVWAEHIVRKLEPFRKFLQVAAQSNTTSECCQRVFG